MSPFDGRRLWRRIRFVWITAGIAATVIFVVWSLVAYRPSAHARAAMVSDATVMVAYQDGIWSFQPVTGTNRPSTALIFFPGALVNPVAYAPLLRAAATAGFRAYMIELPRRGAFGGGDDPEVMRRLDRLLARPDAPRRWVAAGHSRGAVVACDVAVARRAGFAGLVLIGTSHPRDVDLSGLAVPVTKIVGTRDGLATPADVERNRSKLPMATRWVSIEGGNHSHFGWYGFQPGDRWPTIPAEQQRDAMIRAVLDALRNVPEETRGE